MQLKIIFTFLFSAIIFSAAFTQQSSFAVNILQNRQVVKPENDLAQIRKEPFVIQLIMHNLNDVLCYASFSDTIFKMQATDSFNFDNDIYGRAMADYNYNTSQGLTLSLDGWNILFYDKKENLSRFDKKGVKVLDNGKTIVGNKTIKQIYLDNEDETKRKTIPIEKLSQPVYLFFIAFDNKRKEIQRYKLKIVPVGFVY